MSKENLIRLAEKFLSHTDFEAASCVKCGREFGPRQEKKLTANQKFCNNCGAQLILPSEKVDARVEMILGESAGSEIPDSLDARNQRQEDAIARAARSNDLDLDEPSNYQRALIIAVSENPDLFDQRKAGIKK